MWAYICIRPDLGFLISFFDQFCLNPTAEYLSTVKLVYKYLQGTKNNKLVYLDGHQDHIKL